MGLPLSLKTPLIGLVLALTACGWTDDVVKDRGIEYKSSTSLPPLEIPPDLSRASVEERLAVPDAAPPGGSATYSEYASERTAVQRVTQAGVLPGVEGFRVMRDGDQRWLVAEGDPTAYWERVRAFWLENGFVLKVQNPTTGVMETDWAENRADIQAGLIRGLLGKVGDFVYSTATRDMFRTRLERGAQGGTTEIFISHRGAEEVAQGETTTVWQPRPTDPGLEAEMLSRLMVFLGVKEEKARQLVAASAERPPRARLEKGGAGQVSLVLEGGAEQAWRRTGLALDRVGFTVEDRDRSRGLYFVRYKDPLAGEKGGEGFFSKLKFWGDSAPQPNVEYVISLQPQATTTRVVVLDKAGGRDNSPTSERILTLLYDELK